MSEITFSNETVQYISLATKLSGAIIKDCVVEDDRIIFVVEKGNMGVAIGIKAKNLEKLRTLFKKSVKFVEIDEDKKKFIENLCKPYDVKSIEIEGKKVKLQIWDFGGEERFRFLLPTYVRGATGCIFMYDITNYSSIAHIDDWLMVLRQGTEVKLPTLIVGGKADLSDREVTSEEAIQIAKSREASGFIECSAKTGENVETTFRALTRLMLQNSKLI